MELQRLLRPTVPAETAALVAITSGTGFFKDHELETLAEVLDDFHREGEAYGHDCRTLEVAGQIAGFIYFAPVALTDRTWELWWIVVDKARQGRGLGRWLLDRVELAVAQDEGRLLLIETGSTALYNPTRHFYLKHGYRQVAQIPDFYCDGDDKVVYAKRLVRDAV